jgi:hypothetical protein
MTQQQLAAAFRDFDKTHQWNPWVQPLEVPRHLERIQQAMIDDRVSDYPHHFAYPAPVLDLYRSDLDDLRTLAQHSEADLPPALRDLVADYLHRLALRADSFGGDPDTFTRIAGLLDGTPPPDLVTAAWDVLRSPAELVREEPADIDAPAAAERIAQALRDLDLTGWWVQISDATAARMSVNGSVQRLRIRQGALFTQTEIRRLLVHEIGGHVLRWESSRRQPTPLAAIPIGCNSPTEEGLALWLEEQAGLNSPELRRIYAARTVAVHLSQTQGLLTVARALAPMVGVIQAAEIALRCKRGLTDPNAPGCWPKDWAYFGGAAMIRQLHDQDSQAVALLRGVKWSADHLPACQSLADEGLITPVPVDPSLLFTLSRQGDL